MVVVAHNMLNLDYELIDCGDKRRLERFGSIILDRPCPQALWSKKLDITTWNTVTAYYERSSENQGWQNFNNNVLPVKWNIQLDELTLELRPSESNQIGIFPEQLSNWSWINNIIKENSNRPLKILNCFAYTGIASIIASYSGDDNIEVCHVDGAKASVNWAKKNASLSGLDNNKKIRWIVDDVTKFLSREIKRGNKYDGIILDPPAFGRGSKTSSWKFDKDLSNLLKLVNQLLSEKPLFVVFSGHAPGVTSKNMLNMLERNISVSKKIKYGEAIDLIIPSKNGNDLPSSICGRVAF